MTKSKIYIVQMLDKYENELARTQIFALNKKDAENIAKKMHATTSFNDWKKTKIFKKY